MKRWLLTGLAWAAGAGLLPAQEAKFSQAVTRDDFVAAGLAKLSPEELARLDRLVQAYGNGALEAARVAAATAAEARAAAEAKATKAEAELETAKATAAAETAARAKEKPKAESPGFFAKAKVLLAPGTEVEYGEIESRIAGDFAGWEGHTIFTLENGQRWRVANGGSYYSPAVSRPKVKIFPAALGGFWLQIEGVNPRVKVVPVEMSSRHQDR
jgi:hypothetical protein